MTGAKYIQSKPTPTPRGGRGKAIPCGTKGAGVACEHACPHEYFQDATGAHRGHECPLADHSNTPTTSIPAERPTGRVTQ
jgi:hypothetical protein